MWNLQALVVDHLVIVEQDVQINVTRSFINELFAAEALLYVLELVEESQRLEVCFHLAWGLVAAPVARVGVGGLGSQTHLTGSIDESILG